MPSIDEEIKVGARETIQKMSEETIRNINKSRTLIVKQLTSEEVLEPKVVTGLKTIDDVFKYFKPSADIEFEDGDGNQFTEEVKFNNLSDFTSKGISAQSKFINDLELQQDFLSDFIKQLKSNKTLRKILEDPESKEAFLNVIDNWIDEIPE